MKYMGLQQTRRPDWQELIDNIMRKGTPERVYFIELFHDAEFRDALVERFNLADGLDPADRYYEHRKLLACQRFCGMDYVCASLDGIDIISAKHAVADTAALGRRSGRQFQDEHTGPIMSWEDFEKFEWPDVDNPQATESLEWWQENLPEDMCIIGGLFSHFCEWLCWLMGYETLCYSLYDQRDLVEAIAEKCISINHRWLDRVLEFDRVKALWGSDDMGFKTGPLIGPDDMRAFVFEGHRQVAERVHQAGKPYLLHACGKLTELMDDLIDTVKIDAKHSFEDTIEDVRDVKHTYGKRIALLGGIDVDFLCRSTPEEIRKRVRETLDVCMPGGGYCLGTGNSVANYIPMDNYLAMVDEGMLYDA